MHHKPYHFWPYPMYYSYTCPCCGRPYYPPQYHPVPYWIKNSRNVVWNCYGAGGVSVGTAQAAQNQETTEVSHDRKHPIQ